MKTLYLHIGRGKTGTTAQQAYLGRNRDALLAAGVDYLLAGDRGRGVGHQAFAKSFITDMPGIMIPARDPAGIREQTAAEICASPAPAILLSSENLPLANLGDLRAWFDALPVRLRFEVIFLVRSQDELAESEYNQMVKLKRETRSVDAYAATMEGADYDAECTAWRDRFGADAIHARVYDASAGDAVAQFLSCLPVSGLPAPDPAGDAAYANRSVGARALLAARLLNGIEIEGRESLYRKLFAGFEAAGDLPAVLLDAAQARAIRADFAESNRRFARSFLDPAHAACQTGDLGGRRHDDATRDRLFAQVQALGPGAAGPIPGMDSGRR
ncbi:hypothetical protein ACOXXX_18240 [Thalassococcus sp. BH17M4-6]|uniref:hypothetical protein n=1 Tax=Thalassococcus sp. BH17M4-6 TaxID=3413148 RepID=UPI003BC9449E